MEDSTILDLFFERDETAIRETAGKYGKQLDGISYSISESHKDYNISFEKFQSYSGYYGTQAVENITCLCYNKSK